jgi:hypothetical protein
MEIMVTKGVFDKEGLDMSREEQQCFENLKEP